MCAVFNNESASGRCFAIDAMHRMPTEKGQATRNYGTRKATKKIKNLGNMQRIATHSWWPVKAHWFTGAPMRPSALPLACEGCSFGRCRLKGRESTAGDQNVGKRADGSRTNCFALCSIMS